MRPTTYALCALAAVALSAGACAAAVSAASGAARALAYRACVADAALSRLSPAHCAQRPAPVISTAQGF